MGEASFAFDLNQDMDLLGAATPSAEYSQARQEADERRDAFLKAAEGHSPAWIVEHTLNMARTVVMGIIMAGPKEDESVMFGHPAKVAMMLLDRIKATVDCLSEMAFDAHKLQRPDEHEPDCEFRNPKEGK